MRDGYGPSPLGTSPFFFLTLTLGINKRGKKEGKFCYFQQHGWTRRALSEISQTEKDKYCVISRMCGI